MDHVRWKMDGSWMDHGRQKCKIQTSPKGDLQTQGEMDQSKQGGNTRDILLTENKIGHDRIMDLHRTEYG